MNTGRSTGRKPRPDGGSDADAEARHRIHRTLRHALERHPAVQSASGTPDGTYTEIEADMDTSYFGRDETSATIRVSWQPTSGQSTAASDERMRTSLTANFVFHYSESSGFEWGVHLEPNPHVAGQLHVQERASPDDGYSCEPFSLEARSPVGVLWEVLEALRDRIQNDS